MAKIIKEIQFGEHKLKLETGEIARQADGAVFASMNGTQVLATVVWKKEGAEQNDFFPLTVHYQEKSAAAGKTPGGFNKREGRPSEHETLVSRLIDRPIRPLFDESFRHEVQVIATVFSFNPEVPADIVAMIASSAAVALAGLPIESPIAAARVGYEDGIYVLNPSLGMLKKSSLDLVVAGTESGILMVESEAQELSEDVMLGAVKFGHTMMQSVITGINELVKEAGILTTRPQFNGSADIWLAERVATEAKQDILNAYTIKDKQQRYKRLDEIRQNVVSQLCLERQELSKDSIVKQCAALEKQLVRQRILSGEPRIDGRDQLTVRPIAIRTGFLDRTHGSALFTRGETQAIVTATLGNDRDAQISLHVAL